MLDQSMTWAEGGHVPAWLPVRDSAEYKKLSRSRTTRRPPTPRSTTREGWYSGSGSNFEIIVGSAVGAVLAGQLAPKAAVSQIAASSPRSPTPRRHSDDPGTHSNRPNATNGRPAVAASSSPPGRSTHAATGQAARGPDHRAVRAGFSGAVRLPLRAVPHRSGDLRADPELLQHQPGEVRPRRSPARRTTARRSATPSSGTRCGTPSGSRSSPRRRWSSSARLRPARRPHRRGPGGSSGSRSSRRSSCRRRSSH